MSIRKRFGRAGIAALLVAAGLVGLVNNASADDNTSVTTVGVTNVCTIDWGFVTPASTDVSINWNTTNLQWPTAVIPLGNFKITVSATGQPGNRLCGWSVSNSHFLNGATQLLPKEALQQTGTANYGVSNWSISGGTQVALGSPGSGNVAANQWSGTFGAEIDPSAGINQQAPAGTYTSTVTLTQTVGAP
jgi:hypothetical protein